MFERFTDEARAVVVRAQEEARELCHSYIGTEHLLLGLLAIPSPAYTVLTSKGVDHASIQVGVVASLGRGTAQNEGHIPFTPRAKKVLELALREALSLGHNYIGAEHLLLGVIRDGDGVGVQLLTAAGIELTLLREQLVNHQRDVDEPSAPATERQSQANRPAKGQALEKYGRNLTLAARNGELDPVVGRDAEMNRVLRVLVRRTKNNPVLVGEPGVGKTAVVEGLAQLIAAGRVPEQLRGAELITIDLGGMVAGARYRGDFEERIKNVLAEVKARRNVVLFIDEIHTLVGAGASEGSVDAASLLKPLLARGELRTIGATTIDEYRKHFEKDAALARRFQEIKVDEPSPENALVILRSLKERLEEHHSLTIDDSALEAAVRLSSRYMTSRQLPDKAVDLLDEACALVRINLFSAERAGMLAELDEVQGIQEAAVERGNVEAARQAGARIKQLEAELREHPEQPEMAVDAETVASLVEDITGIPVSRVQTTQTRELLGLEDRLRTRVVGQDAAVEAVARAVRRGRAGLKAPTRPSGSFIFAGPSGVGKTELAKALAAAVFGDEKALLTLDMSEFAEQHSVSRLFGAPPGYVGFEEGGQLTEAVRRKPFSVVLLDEVEKAHPDVFNSLLQVLEEGRLTDGQGRVIDFKNVILIMTSNLGTRELSRSRGIGFTSGGSAAEESRTVEKVNEALKGHFRPEFLNRVDEVIVFHPLQSDSMQQVLAIMLTELDVRLTELGLGIELTAAARSWFARKGYDPDLGARPLRRLLQRRVEDTLSELLLSGTVNAGDMVVVDVVGDEVVLSGVPMPDRVLAMGESTD
jgi:ATP-dependent Clp protease ATP-binding subunit ClpC